MKYMVQRFESPNSTYDSGEGWRDTLWIQNFDGDGSFLAKALGGLAEARQKYPHYRYRLVMVMDD